MLCKKTIAALLAAAAVFAAGGRVLAQEYDIPYELSSYGSEVYQTAKGYFGRGSFSGYCGTYVRCQLRAMGIFDGDFDFRGNGNMWYGGFENVYQTSGGYYVYRESGADCLEKLVAKYGSELSNVVVSLPIQSNHSAQYPGAGHVFVIYKIVDNIAYYSESFSFGSHPEGSVIAEDINSLMERYNARHGSANGCVMFSAVDIYKKMENERKETLLVQQEELLMENMENMEDFTFLAKDFTQV